MKRWIAIVGAMCSLNALWWVYEVHTPFRRWADLGPGMTMRRWLVDLNPLGWSGSHFVLATGAMVLLNLGKCHP